MALHLGFKSIGVLLAVSAISACAPTPNGSALTNVLPPSPDKVKASPKPTASASPTPVETPSPTPPTLENPWGKPVNPYPWMKPSPTPSVKPSPTPSPSKTPGRTQWPTITPSSPRPTPTTPTVTPPPTGFGSLIDFFTRPFEQAFGVYDRGSLKRADKLPNSGEGILKIFQARNRAYGTLDLTTLMMAAAKEVHRDIPATESVQIGDVSDVDGGRLGGHGSHQNGLDADIIFLRRNHRMMNPTSQRANTTGFDEDFVENGKVTRNFDVEANWRLIQILVSTGRVDRIFVDQAIKKTFCSYARDRGMRSEWTETLRKLRHWPNHQDHLHLRITCPEKSKNCKTYAAIPAGDGCDRLMDKTDSTAGAFIGNAMIDAVEEEAPAPNDEHGC